MSSAQTLGLDLVQAQRLGGDFRQQVLKMRHGKNHGHIGVLNDFEAFRWNPGSKGTYAAWIFSAASMAT
ncbi:MAG: hypothetical protein ABWY04_17660 [Arthrobacter sp.]